MKTITGLIVALCGIVICIAMVSFANNSRAVNEEGKKQMPTVFKKIVDGKLVDVTPEEEAEMRKKARPPLLTDKASIEIIRKYIKATVDRNKSVLVKVAEPTKKANLLGQIEALEIIQVELCGFE